MMKKRKSWGKIIFVFVPLLAVILNTTTVMAENNLDGEIKTTCEQDFAGDASGITRCKDEAKQCADKLTNKITIDRTISADKKSVDIVVKNESNSKVYVFDVKVNNNGVEEIYKGKKTGEKINIPTYYSENSSRIIDVTASFSDSNTLDVDGINCNRKFNVYSRIRLDSNKVDTVDNPSVKEGSGICWKYRAGQLTDSDVNSDDYKKLKSGGALAYSKIREITGGIEKFNSLFPYCNSAQVENVYSDSQVLRQMYQAASIVINSSSVKSAVLPNHDNDDYIKLDPKNKISLTCDAFSDNATKNVRKFYSVSKADPQKVTFDYTPKTKETVEVCFVECMEEVVVTYGPPVAVKAGLCFEYEVEIRSKVTCNSVINKKSMPDISKYKVCEPTIDCHNGSTSFITQAGPNEEFDSCINSCDGGKYSQSCINKCYNKVYSKKKNKVKKQSLSLVENSISRLKASGFSGNESWCNQKVGDNNTAANVYYAYKQNGYYGGYYTTKEGGLHWESYNKHSKPTLNGEEIKTIDGCYWNDYARFYFNSRDLAIRTVANGQVHGEAWNAGGVIDDLNKWSYTPDLETGVKKGYNNYIGAYCDDNCEYKTSCDGYLNDIAPDGEESRYNAYLKDLKEYNVAIAGCKAKAKCSETDAKYTMTVNNATGEIKTCEVGTDNYDENGKGTCKSWIESSDKKTVITTDSKNNIITKEVSGVCANKKTPTNDDYKTVISFPGSYVNNKNGTVKFKIPASEEGFYTYKNGEYCVPLNAKNVNVDWWIWDQVNKRSEEAKTSVKTTQKPDTTGVTYHHYDGIYNIFARLEKFGYLDWNVDVSCFYAVSNSSKPDKPDKPDNPGDDSSTTTRFPENQDIKAAALDDLFPAKDTSANVTGTSNTKEVEKSTKVSKLNYTSKKNSVTKLADSSTRTIGYNWSCDATNLGIKNYPIAPTSLITKIQSQGDGVYTDESERDFHIRLTRDNIKNIRSNYKDRKYNNYGTGKYDNSQNDVVFYKSNLLSNTNYVSNFSGPHDKLCNNMKNGKCDSSFIVQSDTCVKLNEWLSED